MMVPKDTLNKNSKKQAVFVFDRSLVFRKFLINNPLFDDQIFHSYSGSAKLLPTTILRAMPQKKMTCSSRSHDVDQFLFTLAQTVYFYKITAPGAKNTILMRVNRCMTG